MKIIRLSEGQTRCARVSHPILDNVKKMSDEEFEAAKEAFLFAKDSQARDDIILGHLHYVRTIVGRFLANWSETQRFEEDMISEGFCAVTAATDALKIDTSPTDFHTTVWQRTRDEIEKMLNEARATFGAPRTTNYRKIDEGKDVEYHYAQNLREELDAGVSDEQPEWIDMLDELESLSKEDRESFRAVILRCMENEHNLEEADLTDEELEKINNLAKILGEIS